MQCQECSREGTIRHCWHCVFGECGDDITNTDQVKYTQESVKEDGDIAKEIGENKDYDDSELGANFAKITHRFGVTANKRRNFFLSFLVVAASIAGRAEQLRDPEAQIKTRSGWTPWLRRGERPTASSNMTLQFNEGIQLEMIFLDDGQAVCPIDMGTRWPQARRIAEKKVRHILPAISHIWSRLWGPPKYTASDQVEALFSEDGIEGNRCHLELRPKPRSAHAQIIEGRNVTLSQQYNGSHPQAQEEGLNIIKQELLDESSCGLNVLTSIYGQTLYVAVIGRVPVWIQDIVGNGRVTDDDIGGENNRHVHRAPSEIVITDAEELKSDAQIHRGLERGNGGRCWMTATSKRQPGMTAAFYYADSCDLKTDGVSANRSGHSTTEIAPSRSGKQSYVFWRTSTRSGSYEMMYGSSKEHILTKRLVGAWLSDMCWMRMVATDDITIVGSQRLFPQVNHVGGLQGMQEEIEREPRRPASVSHTPAPPPVPDRSTLDDVEHYDNKSTGNSIGVCPDESLKLNELDTPRSSLGPRGVAHPRDEDDGEDETPTHIRVLSRDLRLDLDDTRKRIEGAEDEWSF
ncbi:MAG: hypothetical protein NZ605_06820, partial [Acidimicrobiales bacterium]|nr:hypothetical protein [Acidimicrobiales bacterium]